MEGRSVELIFDNCVIRRGTACVAVNAALKEGLHIVHGPVGCGKSSLALVIAGLLEPATGSLHLKGISSVLLSIQFPEYHVTGSTLLEECASWGGEPRRILDTVNLADRSADSPFSLSRGELKRLHLACVLAKPCDLLILDEPFSALDCGEKEILSHRLSGRISGITIVFTHEHDSLFGTGCHWEIREGRFVLQDSGKCRPAALHSRAETRCGGC